MTTPMSDYEKLLWLCGSCDAGLPMGCTCPSTRDLQRALLDTLTQLDTLNEATDALLTASHPGHCFDGCDLCHSWNVVKPLVRPLLPRTALTERLSRGEEDLS